MTTATITDLETMWYTERAKLLTYMRRRVGPEQAEDLVQDLFLRAWSAICSGAGYTEHARGYLFRSAHNAVIDFYRARDREPEWEELDAPLLWGSVEATFGEQLANDAMQPDDLALQSETVSEVRFALGRLSDEQHFVVCKRMEGYEFAEIGSEIGKSEGAVKALQHRGMVAMGAQFGVKPVTNVRLKMARDSQVKAKKTPTRRAFDIRDILIREGPMNAPSLKRLSGATFLTVYRVLGLYDELFVTLEGYPGQGNIWGVRGIHDTQKDAA